jgi:energy-coupling factor transporter ATP-binding protein EcfA2
MNTSSPNRWPAIILLLMAVGVPTAAGLAFGQQVSQNPWAALGLALVYEIVVLAFGFVTKIWQKLESKWVDRIADELDAWVQGLTSNYQRRYLKHLFYQHRAFDVKGLTTQGTYTLELEQVFVELSVEPQPLHLTSADPIQVVPEELRHGSHSLWAYLKSGPLADQNFAIIGPPGAGKTTLLKHMALTLTDRRRAGGWDKLPILLFIRDHAKAITDDPGLTLAQAIQDSLTKSEGPAPPPDWFERQLEYGRCLVMLDGLDEVADPAIRQKVVNWVEQKMQAHGRNRFVLTSRPFGYRTNPLSGVTVLGVQPFTSAQVRRFVHNWYTANEIKSFQKDDSGVRLTARQGAEDLLKRLSKTPALTALAVNPLLLTMIANVHRYRSSLPGRRVELYSEICEVFLGKRQQARGLTLDLTPAQKQSVLQPLAYQMMFRELREIAIDEALSIIAEPLAQVNPQANGREFLKNVENTSGLLLERENGVYNFAHKTFQEYLAAAHIREFKLERQLVARVSEVWWHETIRLYAALGDATPVVAACLADEGDKPSVPALTLAIECEAEAQKLKPEARARLKALVNEGVEDADAERRCVVAESLLALRLRQITRASEDKWIDSALLTHAEYQLFLDEARVRGDYLQPDHWQRYQFPNGQGRAPVVGVRPSDVVAFCVWLTQREPGEWNYRLPYAGELESELFNLDSEPAFKPIGYWATTRAGFVYVEGQAAMPLIAMRTLEQYLIDDLELADARAPNLTLDLGLSLELKLDRSLLRDLIRIHSEPRSLDLALDRTRALALDLSQALGLDQAKARASVLDTDRMLARVLIRARVLDHARALVRANARASALTMIVVLIAAQQQRTERPWIDELLHPRAAQAQEEELQQLIEAYVALYVDFVFLEERLQGNMPAVEGIRIVKERKV